MSSSIYGIALEVTALIQWGSINPGLLVYARKGHWWLLRDSLWQNGSLYRGEIKLSFKKTEILGNCDLTSHSKFKWHVKMVVHYFTLLLKDTWHYLCPLAYKYSMLFLTWSENGKYQLPTWPLCNSLWHFRTNFAIVVFTLTKHETWNIPFLVSLHKHIATPCR